MVFREGPAGLGVVQGLFRGGQQVPASGSPGNAKSPPRASVLPVHSDQAILVFAAGLSSARSVSVLHLL